MLDIILDSLEIGLRRGSRYFVLEFNDDVVMSMDLYLPVRPVFCPIHIGGSKV